MNIKFMRCNKIPSTAGREVKIVRSDLSVTQEKQAVDAAGTVVCVGAKMSLVQTSSPAVTPWVGAMCSEVITFPWLIMG